MSAAQHQRHRWLFHPSDHLRNGQSCLNVAAHCVQKQQQTVHVVAFLDSGQQRQNMLIFGGFHRFRGDHVPLHLTDDGEGVDASLAGFRNVRAKLHDLLPLLFFHFRVFVFAHIVTSSPIG